MDERFLVDENVPTTITELLKRKQFQVRRVVDVLGIGSVNSHIVDVATESGEIILTFDSDFLKLRPALRSKVRVIYVDVHPRTPAAINQLLDQHIEKCVRLLRSTQAVRLTKDGPGALGGQ